MEKTKLIALNRLARRLNVPAAWLRAEAQQGRIPAVEAGGRWLSSLEAVESALLSRLPCGKGKRGAK